MNTRNPSGRESSRFARRQRLNSVAVEMHCPLCDAPIQIAKADLVTGRYVDCDHCVSTFRLAREFNPAQWSQQWKLVEPDYMDEQR